MKKIYRPLLLSLLTLTAKISTQSIMTGPDVKLWLRADSAVATTNGLVTSWYDVSGNDNHFTQSITSRQPSISNSPYLANKPAIDFVNDYLENKNAVKIQLEYSLLLKFNAFEQKKGHFGKKLYEYAFSEKKVLAIDRCKGFVNGLDFFDDRAVIYNLNSKDQL